MYRYRRVRAALIDELCECFDRRQAVAILGGRYVGKRHILARLAKACRGRGSPCLATSFLTGRISADSVLPDEGSGPPLDTADSIVQWWADHHDDGWLLLANLDTLPPPAINDLIGRLQDFGLQRVMMTGEAGGLALVDPPEAVFPADCVFVVNHWDREDFNEVAKIYLDAVQAPLEIELDELYGLTGGNIYFLRTVIWAAFDEWARDVTSLDRPHGEPAERRTDSIATQLPWNRYLRYVIRLIANTPAVWDDLNQLLRQGRVDVSFERPSLLELTGLPTRFGNRLELPSSSFQMFLQQRFSPKNMADLHAVRNEWKRAFDLLRPLDAEDRVRPSSLDDVPDAEMLIGRFTSYLHRLAADQPHKLRSLFADGCKCLLGFTTVRFFEKLPQKDAPWVTLERGTPAADRLMRQLKRLSTSASWADDLHCENPHVRIVRMPSLHSKSDTAIVIWDNARPKEVFAERDELLDLMLDEFKDAYGKAVDAEKLRLQTERRRKMDETTGQLLELMGSTVLTVLDAAQLATDRLRENLGYERVVISLITPEGTHLKGFAESVVPEAQGKVLEQIDFDLRAAPSSLHVRAVRDAEPKVFVDALSDGRVAVERIRDANVRAGAIVLLDTGRRRKDGPYLLGTLMTATSGGIPLDQAEFDDLIRFGAKLARVLEQAERVQLQVSTLDNLEMPLVIFDHGGRLRYGNNSAARQFGVTPGWQLAEQAARVDEPPPDSPICAQLYGLAGRAISLDNRMATELRRTREYWALTVEMLQDSLGAYGLATDLSPLFGMFQSLQTMLDVDVMQAEAEPSELTDKVILGIGHFLARLPASQWVQYLELDAERQTFTPQLEFYPDASEQKAALSPPLPGDPQSLQSLSRGAPQMFIVDEEARPGERAVSERGLEFELVPPEHWEAKGFERHCWIDFPLAAGGVSIGKMKVACTIDFSPREFLYLSAFAQMLHALSGVLLTLGKGYELLIADRVEEKERVARNRLDDFTHQLGSPVRDIGLQVEELRKISRRFDDGLESVIDAHRRFDHYARLIKQLHATNDLDLQLNDLRDVLQRLLKQVGNGVGWTITPEEPEECLACFDHAHLELAFAEMVENSRKYCGGELQLELSLNQLPDGFEIVLADNGPGIPIPAKANIFHPQFAIKVGARQKGTGVGLDYVARVIEGHGGTIVEDGRPGRGARFVIQLPSNLDGFG